MEWMAWTLPTALFFVAVGVLLVGMTLLELRRPCVARRGFLPLVTSRGDRLFIGLLASAYLHLLVVASATGPCGCLAAIAGVAGGGAALG